MDIGTEYCRLCQQAEVEVHGRWIPATQEQPGEFIPYEDAVCEDCERQKEVAD